MSQIITNGNRAVLISQDSGRVAARLYANVRNGIASADATLISNTFKTLAGATRWARKQVAA
jgi:hypothetical protein